MKSLIRFIVTLFMPLILIAGGGMLTGWGVTNEWTYVAWAGLAMVVAGLIWGLILWLWASEGSF